MTRLQTSADRFSAQPGPQLRAQRNRLLVAGLLFVLALALVAIPSPALAQTATPAAGADAGVYVVQPGDSWTSVARKTGFSVRDLQAANPGSVRASGWLSPVRAARRRPSIAGSGITRTTNATTRCWKCGHRRLDCTRFAFIFRGMAFPWLATAFTVRASSRCYPIAFSCI